MRTCIKKRSISNRRCSFLRKSRFRRASEVVRTVCLCQALHRPGTDGCTGYGSELIKAQGTKLKAQGRRLKAQGRRQIQNPWRESACTKQALSLQPSAFCVSVKEDQLKYYLLLQFGLLYMKSRLRATGHHKPF